RSMSASAGQLARAELRRRGLLYFEDVTDEARAWPQEARAAVALGAASCVIDQRSREDVADALVTECRRQIPMLWQALVDAPDAAGRERIRAWMSELRLRA